jgi:hypothetical protein
MFNCFGKALAVGFLLLTLPSCKKSDPRCVRIAENITGYALSVVEDRPFTDEQKDDLVAQAAAQKEKVQGQCESALKNDTDGGVSLWADCMVDAETAEQAQRCRSVGTRPDY